MKDTKTSEKIAIKQEQKHNFIIVYDTIYKNNSFTTDELALIIKLLGCAPTFKPSHRKLERILNTSDYALRQAEKGLIEKGYLKINKNGRNSEWTITQEPFTLKLSDFKDETLINALIDFEITLKDLKELHRRKYIDDSQFIRVKDAYIKRLKEISSTDWLND